MFGTEITAYEGPVILSLTKGSMGCTREIVDGQMTLLTREVVVDGCNARLVVRKFEDEGVAGDYLIKSQVSIAKVNKFE
jgi:hypothetical protein